MGSEMCIRDRSLASPVPEIYRGSQNYKSRSRDVGDVLLTYFCIFWFEGLAVNQHTKFGVNASSIPEIYRGSQNYKSRSRDVGDAHLDLILHFLA